MIPNLTQLIRTNSKLSSHELGAGPRNIPRHRILFSLMIDLFVVAMITNLITGFFGLSLGSFFSTPSLQKIWSLMRFNTVNLISLGIVAVSYFSLCYFFNDGQSAGARLTGLRLELKTHDLKSAFKASLHTLLVYLSFGWSVGKFSQQMRQHDYRYQDFLGFREMQAPNLVRAIEVSAEEEAEETKAAA